MSNPDDIINVAEAEVGYHEGRDADGDWNNIQKYSEQVPGLGWSDGQPWCATFVSWCALQAGAAELFPRTASCATGLQWFRDRGRSSDYPAIGAQVFYGPGGGSHTGIVYAYDSNYIFSVEGNAQSLDSAVLTPRGFVRMGDIRVGDAVVDPEGHPSVVTGVFPKGVRRVYRVTLQDGSTVEACDEHLWKVKADARKPAVVTTLELARMVANPTMRVRVPQIQPVEYLAEDLLPIAPYLLGLLIGEGGTTSGGLHFTNTDPEILESVRELLPADHALVPHVAGDSAQPGNWRITGAGGKAGNQVIGALRELGLWAKTAHDKFIPGTYKLASAKGRLELLRGLLDADGTIDATGRVEFTSCSRQLALDVQEVVRSLGGHAALNVKTKVFYTSPSQKTPKAASPAYRLQNINMPFDNPFRLPRKADRFRPRNGAWHRRIVSVEYLRDDEVQCIAVSAPSHLYITDGFTPTHNTNATGSAEGDGVYYKKRSRRDSYVYAYGYPAYSGGIVSADPSWGGTGSGGGQPQVVVVSLARVREAARKDAPAPGTPMAYRDGVLVVERALAAEGLLDSRYVDGSFGTRTISAYAAWQRRLGYGGSDADGIPGHDSLARLGSAHGFRVGA
ncbi:LAGLIDADG family homing endonuclease [Uniformispora flossi]|uniref:LAGLIDADG family homing endonuclease n=1 Tax=Uniformispora flossi TaxID=3390723 RepID=UPI003C2EDD68